MKRNFPIPKAKNEWLAFFATTLAGLNLTYAAANPRPTDREIDNAIEQRLLADPRVPGNALDAEVTDAVVTLTGAVDNLLARDHAGQIAAMVRGVYAVTNQITVDPPKRSDETIRQDINNAFLTNPAVEAYELLPQVKNGEVILKGRVQSQRERLLALRLVKGVIGVRAIADEVQVQTRHHRPDSEIAADVRGALATDFLLSRSLVDVAVENGKVVLSGNVPSAGQKTRAHNLSWVAGVRAVDDGKLRVQGWLNESKAAANGAGSDAAIRDAVEKAIARDPFVTLNDVRIDVSGGVVTLSGDVDNLQAKLSAQEAVESQTEVRRVRNLVKVRLKNPPSDEESKRSILAALARDPYLNEAGISARTNRGTVTLEGVVYNSFARTHAEEVTQRQKGVVAVQNHLSVLPSPWDRPGIYSAWNVSALPEKSDLELIEDVRAQLFWNPIVEADKVAVTVADGVVTLSGTVADQPQSKAAERCAREAGAERVKNLLKVTSSNPATPAQKP